MLKRIVQACFLIIGGTLGIFLFPDLLKLLNMDGIPLINNPYVSAILGAIIFYFITFWAIDYVVNFVKWVEESLSKSTNYRYYFWECWFSFWIDYCIFIGFAIKSN